MLRFGDSLRGGDEGVHWRKVSRASTHFLKMGIENEKRTQKKV